MSRTKRIVIAPVSAEARGNLVLSIITVSGADHHEANAALIAFRCVLRIKWRESLSKLTFTNFLLEALLFLPHIYRMVNYLSEFFHSANLCKELVDGILDRLCLSGLVSRHLRIQRNVKDKN